MTTLPDDFFDSYLAQRSWRERVPGPVEVTPPFDEPVTRQPVDREDFDPPLHPRPRPRPKSQRTWEASGRRARKQQARARHASRTGKQEVHLAATRKVETARREAIAHGPEAVAAFRRALSAQPPMLPRRERIRRKILKVDVQVLAVLSLALLAYLYDDRLRYMSAPAAVGTYLYLWAGNLWPLIAIAAACIAIPRLQDTRRERAEANRKAEQRYARAVQRAEAHYRDAAMRRARIEATVTVDIVAKVVHGDPGATLSVARFGSTAAVGAEGERRTVVALQPVLDRFPAARLFNGVRWPGTDNSDIDHVLVAGKAVAVIDSKMWAAGTYMWNGKALWRDGSEREAPRIANASKALEAKITQTSKPEIRTWVVVHSDGEVVVEPSSSHGFALVTPAELVEQVGAWLLRQADVDVVDRDVLEYVVTSMIDPTRAPSSDAVRRSSTP